MMQVPTLRRTPHIGVAFLLILLVSAVIAMFQPLAGAITVLLGALLVALPALWQTAGAQRSSAKPAYNASPASLPLEPTVQRSVWTADGTPRQAIVVPLESTDACRLVLTVDGYALINEDGVIIHRLKS